MAGNALTKDADEGWAELRARRGVASVEDLRVTGRLEGTPYRAMSQAADYLEDLEEAIRSGKTEEAARLLNFAKHIRSYLRRARVQCDCDN